MEIPPMRTGEDIKTNLIGVHKAKRKKERKKGL